MLLFLPTIGGLVQFEQEVNGDPGVNVSIHYDSEHAEIVATLVQELQAVGFT